MGIGVFSPSVSLQFRSGSDFRLKHINCCGELKKCSIFVLCFNCNFEFCCFSNSNNIYIAMNDFIIMYFQGLHTPYIIHHTSKTTKKNTHTIVKCPQHKTEKTEIRLVENLFHVYSIRAAKCQWAKNWYFRHLFWIYFGVRSIKFGCHHSEKETTLFFLYFRMKS